MFRPLPVLTLLAVPSLALLVWLGCWQWGRMGEKAIAIADWEARQGGHAIEWDAALCDIRASYYGQTIVPPDGVQARQIRFHGRSASGELGWRLMSPLAVPDCFSPDAGRFILVQTGFETFRGASLPAPTILMYARPPEVGAFDAENNSESGEFFRFDIEDFARALGGLPIAADIWLIEADNEMPPHLANVPPGQHLGYALTWWGLAIGLLSVYALIHVQAGRLRFTRR